MKYNWKIVVYNTKGNVPVATYHCIGTIVDADNFARRMMSANHNKPHHGYELIQGMSSNEAVLNILRNANDSQYNN